MLLPDSREMRIDSGFVGTLEIYRGPQAVIAWRVCGLSFDDP
jgi:hypothetical protein